MIRLNLKAGNNIVQVEGETHLDVFKKASNVQEVFGEKCCGKCKSSDLQYVIRKAESGKKVYEYPEIRCGDCGAKLKFGQSEDGSLFPIRFQRENGEYKLDANNKKIPQGVNGWVKYNHTTKQEE